MSKGTQPDRITCNAHVVLPLYDRHVRISGELVKPNIGFGECTIRVFDILFVTDEDIPLNPTINRYTVDDMTACQIMPVPISKVYRFDWRGNRVSLADWNPAIHE